MTSLSAGWARIRERRGCFFLERLALRPVDLDKPESRQGKMKTPLVQALDYVEELPRLEQPRFVVTCNFETFRVYDRDAWAKSQLINHPFEFTLAELVDHPEYLSFITDPANNVLCVRLVFCLFCEDADLFPKDAFLHYLLRAG